MKAECGGFLQAAVLETVLRLLESKQSAELNPAKMDSLDDACNNAEFLLQILDQVNRSSYCIYCKTFFFCQLIDIPKNFQMKVFISNILKLSNSNLPVNFKRFDQFLRACVL